MKFNDFVAGKWVRPKENNSSHLSSGRWKCVSGNEKELTVADSRGITYQIPTEEADFVPDGMTDRKTMHKLIDRFFDELEAAE